MSVRERVEQRIRDYIEAYNDRKLTEVMSMFDGRAEIYTPYSMAAVGTDQIRAVHETWFQHDVIYTSVEITSFEEKGEAVHCAVSYDLVYPDRSEDEQLETGTSVNVLIKNASGTWMFLSSSIQPARTKLND